MDGFAGHEKSFETLENIYIRYFLYLDTFYSSEFKRSSSTVRSF